LLSMLPELSTSSLFLKASQWTVTLFRTDQNVCMHTCAMSKMSISETTTVGCCCMTMRPLSPLNVKQFVASKLMCYSASPLLTRFGTSRLPPPPTKEKLVLEGQSFSDIWCDMTELLKVVSLQDFQHAFKDLYEWAQRCMELGVIILQVCNTLHIHLFFS
jgi:hypothetical protein